MTVEEKKIFKDQFVDLVKVAKKIKKPVVTFQNGMIMGTDDSCATLSTITYDIEKFNLFQITDYQNMRLTFHINELIAWLKNFNIHDEYTLINDYGIIDPKCILLSEENFKIQMDQMFQRVQLYMNFNGRKTLENYPIREDELFENALQLKSKEGSILYNLDNRYLMSTFSSIHPVTKSDKLLVSVYELDDGSSFLTDFVIKKKSEEIHEYIRYRNLLR